MNMYKAAKLFIILLPATLFFGCGPKADDKNSSFKQTNTISDIEGFIVKPSSIDQTISIS